MKEKIEQLQKTALESLEKVSDLKELESLRVSLLGKKGELTGILKTMGSLPAEERPAAGQLVNNARAFIEGRLEEFKTTLAAKERRKKIEEEAIDVTIPGRTKTLGGLHPLTKVKSELIDIFIGMGYEIVEGPDIETYYYNFDALNIPEDHPARDEQDTFYIDGGFALRTATSPVQVRVMEQGKLPIRMVAPGRVFRSDEVDATHSPVFHQMEGLVVGKDITMGNLKAALENFSKALFGENIKVRFRPHYFPFTEPSAEMDVSCFACGGEGCRICKGEGWIELLGCGMVHPRVLKMSGIDPDVYSGYAFGMGLERTAMMKYGIADMRLMYENDVKFLKQF